MEKIKQDIEKILVVVTKQDLGNKITEHFLIGLRMTLLSAISDLEKRLDKKPKDKKDG